MKLKNEMVVICLIFFILISISAVSAADNNTDIITKVNNGNDNNLSIDNEDILTANEGSFADLNTTINSGTSIELSRDYVYSGSDTIKNGVIISKNNTVIDGKGHTIDAKGQSRIFYVTGTTVTLKNIKFINGNANSGGAIYGYGDNLRIINCTFTDNTANNWGGAIFSYPDSYSVFVNSTFINNKAKYGGAIFAYNYVIDYYDNFTMYANRHDIINCTFDSNTATSDGGALAIMGQLGSDKHINDDHLNIRGSLFVNNVAPQGDAISNMLATYVNMTDSVILGNPENLVYSWGRMFFADNNWWGSTIENKSVRPNITSAVTLNNWLYFDVIPVIEKSTATISINNLYNPETGETSIYKTSRLPSVDVDVNAVNANISANNVVLDHSGKAEVTFTLLGECLLTADCNNIRVSKTIRAGSFAQLQSLISNANDGETITLDRDYVYTLNVDKTHTGITLVNRQSLIIDGNGHIVNAAGQSRAFGIDIESTDITFMNMIISNANTDLCTRNYDGMAILCSGINCTFINCTFINCTSEIGSGTLASYATGTTVEDCKFINNTIEASTGAGIYHVGSNLNVINTTFINNNAINGMAGAIYSQTHTDHVGTNIIDCTFINNTARTGGAIYNYGSNDNIIGCTFIANAALSDNILYGGGAIFISNTTVSDCVFRENKAGSGAAAYLSDNCIIDRSIFVNNTAESSQGIIFSVSESTISDSIFLNNDAGFGNVLVNIYGGVVMNYNWFGNTDKNYNRHPMWGTVADMTKWLFINATLPKFSNDGKFLTTQINFFVYDNKTGNVIHYDVHNLPDFNFTLSAQNLTLDKTEFAPGENINGNLTYRATIGEEGYLYIYDNKGTIIADYENVHYVLPFKFLISTSIEVNSTVTICKTESKTFYINITPFDDDAIPFLNERGRIKYTSNDTNIVKVEVKGYNIKLIGVNVGVAEVTIKYDGKNVMGEDKYYPSTRTILVNVTKMDTHIVNVTSIPDYLDVGSSGNFIIGLQNYKNRSVYGVTYEVINNNPKVLEMYAAGSNIQYKTIGSGLANITVRFAGNSDYNPSSREFTFEVGRKDADLHLSDEVLSMEVAQRSYLGIFLRHMGEANLTLTSNDTNVATIEEDNGNYIITAIGGGVANITVAFNGDDGYIPDKAHVIVYVEYPVTYIDVNGTLDAVVNHQFVINPILRDRNGKHIGGAFTFTSNDTSVVEIDEYGVGTANAIGKANITINFEGNYRYLPSTANVIVTVSVLTNNINVDTDITLDLKQRTRINATLDYSDTLKYESNDTSVVSIDSRGYMTANGVGVAEITVYTEGTESILPCSKIVTVTVIGYGTYIDINDTMELVLENSSELIPIVRDLNGNIIEVSKYNIKYETNDSSVVNVDKNGKIVANKVGKANITITFTGQDKYLNSTANVIVSVVTVPTYISVASNIELYVDDMTNINATLNPISGKLYYSSNNTDVIIIDENGNLQALSEGVATVSISYYGTKIYDPCTETVSVKVSLIPTKIDVGKTFSLVKGENDTIIAALTPDVGRLTYKSNNESIVTVNKNGVVTPVDVGETTITVAFAGDGKYAPSSETINVTVYREYIPTSIEVNDTLDLNIYDEVDLGAILNPSNAGKLNYTSSDENVVKVADGVVTAVGIGKANITVSYNGGGHFLPAESAIVAVTVSPISTSIETGGPITINLTENATVNYTFSHPEAGNVEFIIANPNIISIKNGVVIGNNVGKTNFTILFRGNENYSSSNATVDVEVVAVDTTIIADSISVNVTESASIGAILSPLEGAKLIYSTNDNDLIRIYENGTVTGLKVGIATLTISFAGQGKYKASAKNITVTVTDVETSIDAADSISVNVTESASIGALLTPSQAGNLTYVSSDVSVVSVDENGVVTGVRSGEADVVVSFAGSGKYASSSRTVHVNVTVVETSIEAPDSIAVNVTEWDYIRASLNPNVGNLTYVSSDVSVVSVDENGVVTGVRSGEADIVVSFAGAGKYASSSRTVHVNVTVVETSIDAPDSISVNVTESVSIAALLDPNVGNLTYVSSDVSVVSVDENGVVTGVKSGEADIVISFQGFGKYISSSRTVHVNVTTVEAEINANDTISLFVDDLVNVNATLNPNVGKLNYTSNDSSVVAVDENGNIKAIKEGTALITVSYAGEGKYLPTNKTIVVNVSRIATSITVDDKMLMEIGLGLRIRPVLGPESNIGALNYTSSDESVIEIDQNGYMFSVSYGNAIVTISYAGNYKYLPCEATINITVNTRPTSIKVQENISLGFGESTYIGATLTSQFMGHVDGVLHYVSSDPSIASINDDGLITGHKRGNVTITITFDGLDSFDPCNATVNVEVTSKTTSVEVKSDQISLKVDSDANIVATLHGPSNGVLRYVSSNSSIATVDANGKVIARGEGVAIITVFYAGNDDYHSSSKDVTVSVTRISTKINSHTDIEMKADEEQNIGAYVTPNGGNLNYISSNESIVTVDRQGNLKAVDVGTAVVTIIYEGDYKYLPSEKEVLITVSRIPTSINITNIVLNVGDEIKLDNILNPSGAGRLTYESWDSDIFDVDSRGNLEAISEGSAELSIDFAGNSRYLPSSASVLVTVQKIVISPSDYRFNVEVSDDDDSVTFTVELPEDADGSFIVVIDGVDVYGNNVEDGKSMVVVNDLATGDHQVTMRYSGNNEKYSSITETTTIHMGKYKIDKNEDIVIPKGGEVVYRVHLTKDTQAMEGKNMTFTFRGQKYYAVTDRLGYANITLNIPSKAKTYTIKASFGQVRVSNKIIVESIIIAKNVKVKKSPKAIKIKVSLKKVDKKYLTGKKLTLKFNGNKFTANTNKKGVAKFVIKNKFYSNLKLNKKYAYTVSYSKDVVKRTIKFIK